MTDRPRHDDTRRGLPSVDAVLRTDAARSLLAVYAHSTIVALVRDTLEGFRSSGSAVQADEVAATVARTLEVDWVQAFQPVINATGVILHTNLGRAPLSQAAVEAMIAIGGYSTLEYRLSAGVRGSRQEPIGDMIRVLTGAEAAHVVVNNAAAVMLALRALASRKEVLVSRSQAVEIGGGFRVPDIMRQSGAKLVEVGTTNRTRLSDYDTAVTHRTAAILHVHSSNFRQIGFTESVPLTDLAGLARRRDLYLIDDNGSGALLDTADFSMTHEPMPAESIRAGAHVVAFSADKLLGGPQGGILTGDRAAIGRIASHPVARALRPDKMTLAALAATLRSYLRGRAVAEIPVWRMIAESRDALQARSATVAARLAAVGVPAALEPGESTVGGGSLPGETLPTVHIVLPGSISARALRLASPSIIAVTRHDRVHVDLRTVLREQEEGLISGIVAAGAVS